jgi:hypothetical protein
MVTMNDELRIVVKTHMKSVSTWKEGEPVTVFWRDGYPCVRYESGNWWHYNLKRGTWF